MAQQVNSKHREDSTFPNQAPYLTVRQASKLLCISTWVLYQSIRIGELPVIRWGRRVVLDRDDLARFVATKRDEGIAGAPTRRLVTDTSHIHDEVGTRPASTRPSGR